MAIRNVFGAQSIRQKLLLGTLFLAIIPVAVTSVIVGRESLNSGRAALEAQAREALIAQRASKAAQVTSYFDTLANEVQVLIASVTAAQAAVASGQVRALAVLSDRRSPLLPGVPTIEEEGLPRLNVQTWIGFLAPAGTPSPIVETLNATLNRILRSERTRAWLLGQGLEPVGGSAGAFEAEIRADLENWGKATRRLGLHKQ